MTKQKKDGPQKKQRKKKVVVRQHPRRKPSGGKTIVSQHERKILGSAQLGSSKRVHYALDPRWQRKTEGAAFYREPGKKVKTFKGAMGNKIDLIDGKLPTEIITQIWGGTEDGRFIQKHIRQIAKSMFERMEEFEGKYYNIHPTLLPFAVWFEHEPPQIELVPGLETLSFRLNDSYSDIYFRMINVNQMQPDYKFYISADPKRSTIIFKDIYATDALGNPTPVGYILHFDKRGFLDKIETRKDPEFLHQYAIPGIGYRTWTGSVQEVAHMEQLQKEKEKERAAQKLKEEAEREALAKERKARQMAIKLQKDTFKSEYSKRLAQGEDPDDIMADLKQRLPLAFEE